MAEALALEHLGEAYMTAGKLDDAILTLKAVLNYTTTWVTSPDKISLFPIWAWFIYAEESGKPARNICCKAWNSRAKYRIASRRR